MFFSSQSRISALDGLRGLAIILVILNHFRLDVFYNAIPVIFHPFLQMIINNGKIGVGLLFMLSGYLMATIYPKVNSYLQYYQKRYTRIFPALMTMCLSLSFIRYFWETLSLLHIIGIICAFILLGSWLWRFIQKRPARQSLGTFLFYSFFATQVITILLYLALMNFVPAPIFYQIWPEWTRQIIYFFVNSTLTLPFGIYVPQLDGVYWSLVTEVFFYLLYPLVCIPVVNTINTIQSKSVKYILFFSLFPFFIGLSELFKHILGFQIMQIHFAIFFVFGIILGNKNTDGIKHTIQSWLKKLPPLILLIFSLTLILANPLLDSIVKLSTETKHLLWVIPSAIAFIIALNEDNSLTKFLSSKILVTLGHFSYALYLTHTIAIEIFVRSGEPTTIIGTMTAVLSSIVVMTALAYILHIGLEKPYFKKIVTHEKNQSSLTQTKQSWTTKRFSFSLTIVMIFLVWYAYRTPVSLKAEVTNHTIEALPPTILLSQTPLTLHFIGTNNNLGSLFFHFQPLDQEMIEHLNLHQGTTRDQLEITITQNEKDISTNTFNLEHLSGSRFHPVGLPIFPNSKDLEFEVTLRTIQDHPEHFISLVTSDTTFRSIYFLDTHTLLQPKNGLKHTLHKLTEPFTNKSTYATLLLLTPLLLMLLILSFNEKKLKDDT